MAMNENNHEPGEEVIGRILRLLEEANKSDPISLESSGACYFTVYINPDMKLHYCVNTTQYQCRSLSGDYGGDGSKCPKT